MPPLPIGLNPETQPICDWGFGSACKSPVAAFFLYAEQAWYLPNISRGNLWRIKPTLIEEQLHYVPARNIYWIPSSGILWLFFCYLALFLHTFPAFQHCHKGKDKSAVSSVTCSVLFSQHHCLSETWEMLWQWVPCSWITPWILSIFWRVIPLPGKWRSRSGKVSHFHLDLLSDRHQQHSVFGFLVCAQGQSTDGSEVQHLAEPGRGCLGTVCAVASRWLGPPNPVFAQLAFCLWSYIQVSFCPWVPRRKELGLEYQGMAVRGKERGCVDWGTVLHQCSGAPQLLLLNLFFWAATAVEMASSTPLCTLLQQYTQGHISFCLPVLWLQRALQTQVTITFSRMCGTVLCTELTRVMLCAS